MDRNSYLAGRCGFIALAACLILLFGCGRQPPIQHPAPRNETQTGKTRSLFTLLGESETGISFTNRVEDSPVVNVYFYLNAYNGGGVAIGDINNDGLPDIYFTSNLEKNKLYLNKGNLRFEDITKKAGVASGDDWCAGVTMADVNGDGFLDIYVCRALHSDPAMRANLLYINNGDLTFTERGKEYGVADESLSTQATFFDYDLDGDLDLFVGNHLKRPTLDHDESYRNFTNPTFELSDHLYRNNGNGTFSDVTLKAGILDYGVTLGVIAGDIDQDGWPDLYVAKDQQEPDVLFLNNRDGTFRNAIHEAVKHITDSSMGIDLADFNNDGLLDIMVADMMPEGNYRQKTQMPVMNPKLFWTRVAHGYHYQYTRNVLQVNNGNGTFSEVAHLAGVAATDWSWTTMLADFDNDGWKDLFVTCGVKRDLVDKDYMVALKAKLKRGVYEGNLKPLMDMIPATPIPNKFYRNNGNLTFSDQTTEAGFDRAGFSNGAAYADLDLDGDLDIVINNINSPASVYRNNGSQNATNHFLRIRLTGTKPNVFGLGAKVTVKSGDLLQYQELTLTRGFQSSVEPTLHFGLGEHTIADQVFVEWPGGMRSVLTNVTANQVINVAQKGAIKGSADPWLRKTNLFFTEVTGSSGVDFRHLENDYDDYEKEILLPYKTSQFGPKLAVGDVDGNGLDDFFIGGASGQAGVLFLQVSEFRFQAVQGPWTKDSGSEDVGALFFDADNDGDLDLYVVSGGNEFPEGSPLLQDRLYLNQGNATFVRSMDALPEMRTSKGCVTAADYDGDGDLDLFVGGRLVPGKYPFPPRSYLLRNDHGKFTDVTASAGDGLIRPGLVSCALWTDFDQDNDLDLILVGEWMPITFFQNQGGTFINKTKEFGLDNTAGWWNTIVQADFDGDGDPDYVVGNLGLNTRYRATEKQPLRVYCDDFDHSGTYDIVLAYFESGVCYPVRGRERSVEQNPFLATKFPTYKAFAKASIDEIYGSGPLANALHYEAKLLASSYIENRGGAAFAVHPLPVEAQVSAVQGIVARDFNGDGKPDILLAGNFYPFDVETGRSDAGIGLLLLGDGTGGFRPVKSVESGFFAPGDVRDLKLLSSGSNRPPLIVVANNNERVQVFRLNSAVSATANK